MYKIISNSIRFRVVTDDGFSPVTVAECNTQEAAEAAKRLLSGAVQVSTGTTK